jgi:hypothetical protein
MKSALLHVGVLCYFYLYYWQFISYWNLVDWKLFPIFVTICYRSQSRTSRLFCTAVWTIPGLLRIDVCWSVHLFFDLLPFICRSKCTPTQSGACTYRSFCTKCCVQLLNVGTSLRPGDQVAVATMILRWRLIFASPQYGIAACPHLALRILGRLLDFWKICSPLVNTWHRTHFSTAASCTAEASTCVV